MNDNEFYLFLPGFLMGITRSIVSHPFEILKVRSQLNIKSNNSLLQGIHLSILANGLEKGCQFYFYDYYRTKNDSNIKASLKSSFLSTLINIPYNYLLINKTLLKNKKLSINKIPIIYGLEYTRSLVGSTIFLYFYNLFKEAFYPLWLSAFFSTTIVWSITYPIDHIRNRIMVGSKINLKNIYKGVQYPILRSIPSSIIGMYVYEKSKNYLTSL